MSLLQTFRHLSSRTKLELSSRRLQSTTQRILASTQRSARRPVLLLAATGDEASAGNATDSRNANQIAQLLAGLSELRAKQMQGLVIDAEDEGEWDEYEEGEEGVDWVWWRAADSPTGVATFAGSPSSSFSSSSTSTAPGTLHTHQQQQQQQLLGQQRQPQHPQQQLWQQQSAESPSQQPCMPQQQVHPAPDSAASRSSISDTGRPRRTRRSNAAPH